MPIVEFSPRFVRCYRKLPAAIRAKVDKQLTFLAKNPQHPSLQTKQIQGFVGIYEARVDQNYRFTYERLSGDKLLLRAVGRHDETLKNP
jgi:mRNA-degrading endonuclease RelE of RelBE toxin-antitoxin system